MIKFFRKIRQNTIKENRFSKYFLYAVGEIVLVVIGILIALQINNWNEQNKIDVLEIEALKEIASDLQYDVLSLEHDIALNLRGLKRISIIRDALNGDQAYNDSLAIHFGGLDFNTTYTIKTSGFDNLRNLGFQIVSNDSLRKSITDLYSSEYSFLKEREELAEQRTYEYFSPRYISYFKSMKSIDGSNAALAYYTPRDFEAMKSDDEFDILLDYLALVKKDNLFSLNQTIVEIKLTLSLINDYLDTI
ncbi:DUF6090 family protein [Winogradskyella sp. A3E31]|uniref:DUF6090 family protein n=1 Tax=Winogradskyella sp. A3E31 TaxID=3349637 RepID=UPI00398AEE45